LRLTRRSRGHELYVNRRNRLARNLEDLPRIVRQLSNKGGAAHFIMAHQFIITGRAESKSWLILGAMSAAAEFERELIRNRQREGIALRRIWETTSGRGLLSGRESKSRRGDQSGIPKRKPSKKARRSGCVFNVEPRVL